MLSIERWVEFLEALLSAMTWEVARGMDRFLNGLATSEAVIPLEYEYDHENVSTGLPTTLHEQKITLTLTFYRGDTRKGCNARYLRQGVQADAFS